MSRFSFLIPAYKSAFFKDALETILCQSYEDFSVIVSDDCSPEPVKGIVDTFSGYYNLRYRRNETNIGAEHLVDHWNLLLSETDSEFVIIAGDDDRYDTHFLEEVNVLTEKYPSCDLFCTGLNMIDESGIVLKSYSEGDGLISFEPFVSHLVDPNAILCMGNYVFRRSALLKNGGFVSFPLAWKSDSASQAALARNGVASSSRFLFGFRMSGKNLSSRTEPDSDKDSQKLSSILAFDDWAQVHIYPYVPEKVKRYMRRKLDGELRIYLWTQTLFSRLRIFKRLSKEKWFFNGRNWLSFLKCVFSI